MRRGNFWTLGVLFGSMLAYTGWTGFEMPEFLMGKTNEISGKVIDVFPNRDVQSHSRRIKYIYSVNDNYYVDFKKLGTKDDRQAIGNEVHLIYSIKKPERHKIEKLSAQFKNTNQVKYYSNKERGFIELRLINGIFKFKEYAERGKIINDFIGEYQITGDTIKFNNYLLETVNNLNKNRPELFVINDNQLTDIITKRVFKKIE
jgi:hypothetical protein